MTQTNLADVKTDRSIQLIQVERKTYDLFDRFHRKESWNAELNKAVEPENQKDQHSDQGIQPGLKLHPFNMDAAIRFKNQNPHHSTCIETKARAITGLGFKNDKVYETLDDLCDVSFQDVMNAGGEDYTQVGNIYLEVVRKGPDDPKIVGIHKCMAPRVRVVVEDETFHKHYIVEGEQGVSPRELAPFGQLKLFLERRRGVGATKTATSTASSLVRDSGRMETGSTGSGWGIPSQRSELIHIPRSTSMSQWYGFPDWLSAVAAIELVQCILQERYDFFLNRGVPEMMLFLLKEKMGKPEMDLIQAALQSTVGQGNQHKTLAMNIEGDNIEVQLEKLALEGSSGSEAAFSSMNESLAMDIVTAHRVPFVLANIQTPGKLGATNELPNALLSFQTLVAGPEQATIQTILGNTLGNPKLNGGLGLKKKDFELKKCTDEIMAGLGQQQPGAMGNGDPGKGMQALGTLGRMRTPAASANGRKLSEGVKKEDYVALLAEAFDAVLERAARRSGG